MHGEKKDKLGCKHNHSFLTDLVSLDMREPEAGTHFQNIHRRSRRFIHSLITIYTFFFFLNTPFFRLYILDI